MATRIADRFRNLGRIGDRHRAQAGDGFRHARRLRVRSALEITRYSCSSLNVTDGGALRTRRVASIPAVIDASTPMALLVMINRQFAVHGKSNACSAMTP